MCILWLNLVMFWYLILRIKIWKGKFSVTETKCIIFKHIQIHIIINMLSSICMKDWILTCISNPFQKTQKINYREMNRLIYNYSFNDSGAFYSMIMISFTSRSKVHFIVWQRSILTVYQRSILQYDNGQFYSMTKVHLKI